MQPKNPLLVGLDVASVHQAENLAQKLAAYAGGFKIGLELFNTEGPSVFERVRKAAGGDVPIFYDAKLHDIPNTVASAVRAASRHGLWMINVHASGGRTMMRAAVDAALGAPSALLVIAVTVLTSLDEAALREDLGVARSLREQVVALAKLAQDSGCHGVVASPQEAGAIRAACGPGFLIITPGVRPAGADLGDQKRVATPAEAIGAGANYLVVARPIIAAPDPATAARDIAAQIASAS
jgi:orotidine-5'-phosphate decarboxylase